MTLFDGIRRTLIDLYPFNRGYTRQLSGFRVEDLTLTSGGIVGPSPEWGLQHAGCSWTPGAQVIINSRALGATTGVAYRVGVVIASHFCKSSTVEGFDFHAQRNHLMVPPIEIGYLFAVGMVASFLQRCGLKKVIIAHKPYMALHDDVFMPSQLCYRLDGYRDHPGPCLSTHVCGNPKDCVISGVGFAYVYKPKRK